MANEYYSRLVSNLYNTKDVESAEDVLKDIGASPDGFFLYPIYDSYLRFQKEWALAHLKAISKIDSPETLEILKKIAADQNTEAGNFVECLHSLEKFSYFDDQIFYRAYQILVDFSFGNKIFFHLADLLSYIEKSKKLKEVESLLAVVFRGETFDKDERQTALSYYLRCSPKEHINSFIENYDSIKDKPLEELLVRELLGWHGSAVDRFIEKARTQGSSMVRGLIGEKRKKKEIEETQVKAEKDSKDIKNFANVKEVTEISQLRKKINEISISTTDLGFPIFPDDETILSQLSTVTGKDSLTSRCINLRDVIQNVTQEATDHGLT